MEVSERPNQTSKHRRWFFRCLFPNVGSSVSRCNKATPTPAFTSGSDIAANSTGAALSSPAVTLADKGLQLCSDDCHDDLRLSGLGLRKAATAAYHSKTVEVLSLDISSEARFPRDRLCSTPSQESPLMHDSEPLGTACTFPEMRVNSRAQNTDWRTCVDGGAECTSGMASSRACHLGFDVGAGADPLDVCRPKPVRRRAPAQQPAARLDDPQLSMPRNAIPLWSYRDGKEPLPMELLDESGSEREDYSNPSAESFLPPLPIMSSQWNQAIHELFKTGTLPDHEQLAQPEQRPQTFRRPGKVTVHEPPIKYETPQDCRCMSSAASSRPTTAGTGSTSIHPTSSQSVRSACWRDEWTPGHSGHSTEAPAPPPLPPPPPQPPVDPGPQFRLPATVTAGNIHVVRSYGRASPACADQFAVHGRSGIAYARVASSKPLTPVLTNRQTGPACASRDSPDGSSVSRSFTPQSCSDGLGALAGVQRDADASPGGHCLAGQKCPATGGNGIHGERFSELARAFAVLDDIM